MTLMDIAAGVLIGNLFAAASLYGLHIAFSRERDIGHILFGGAAASLSAFLVTVNAIGETDVLRVTIAAAFFAALVTAVFFWGARTILRHEKTGEFSVKAWAAVLVPVSIGIIWLWPYAPIG